MERHRPRALIVDDEADIRTLLSDLLAADGFEVCCTDSCNTAHNLALEKKVDVIISDVACPMAAANNC